MSHLYNGLCFVTLPSDAKFVHQTQQITCFHRHGDEEANPVEPTADEAERRCRGRRGDRSVGWKWVKGVPAFFKHKHKYTGL